MSRGILQHSHANLGNFWLDAFFASLEVGQGQHLLPDPASLTVQKHNAVAKTL